VERDKISGKRSMEKLKYFSSLGDIDKGCAILIILPALWPAGVNRGRPVDLSIENKLLRINKFYCLSPLCKWCISLKRYKC
jgi:hypothetical protein